MSKSLFIIFSVAAAGLAACGPKPIAYIKIDHPGTQDILVEGVGIYYDHESTPKGAQIIEPIKETAQDTDCKNAAMIALVQLQKKALEKGGNALVHLKTVHEGEEPISNEEGFWCERSKDLEEGADLTHKIWKITWKGDIARIVEAAEEEEDL
jgi:hypothetical protein